MDQKPSVGRIVHYVLGMPTAATAFQPLTIIIRPAIILSLNNEGNVNLSVFTDIWDAQQLGLPQFREAAVRVAFVKYDPEKRSGTWHWPPRT